jgi:hypothetical protein
MNKHVKCARGWLMVNNCIVPVSTISTIGISGGRPCTVLITLGAGHSTTLDCDSPAMAVELLSAIWEALQSAAQTDGAT